MGDNTAIIIAPKMSKMMLTTIRTPPCHTNTSSVSLHTDHSQHKPSETHYLTVSQDLGQLFGGFSS